MKQNDQAASKNDQTSFKPKDSTNNKFQRFADKSKKGNSDAKQNDKNAFSKKKVGGKDVKMRARNEENIDANKTANKKKNTTGSEEKKKAFSLKNKKNFKKRHISTNNKNATRFKI